MRTPMLGPRGIDLRLVTLGTLLGLLEVANVALAIHQASMPWSGWDWDIWTRAGHEISSGINPYAAMSEGAPIYRWSPVAAWVAVPVQALGLVVWRAAHFAALALIRPRWVALLVGTSFPFWADVTLANIMTFAFVFAWLSMRGSAWASAAYLLLCILVPKPVMAPVALWILWQYPGLRIPFVAAVLAQIVVSFLLGYLVIWSEALLASSTEMQSGGNYWPSYFLGYLWTVFGIPASILFVARGRLGLASLLAVPYYLPYYLVFAFLELVPGRTRPRSHEAVKAEASMPVGRRPGWSRL